MINNRLESEERQSDAPSNLGSEAMGRDKGRGKPLPMGHREVHVTCLASLLTTAAQRAGGILGLSFRLTCLKNANIE